jgi:hypothetical protein
MNANTAVPTDSKTIAWGQDMLTGEMRPYYADQPTPPSIAPLPVPVQQPTQVVQAPRDPWPARLLSGGAAVTSAAVAIGHYANQVGQLAHACEEVGVGFGALAVGIAVVRGVAPRVSVNVTNNVTGSQSSASASSDSRSASGWKSKA